mgnify:CR=1 FL=1
MNCPMRSVISRAVGMDKAGSHRAMIAAAGCSGGKKHWRAGG